MHNRRDSMPTGLLLATSESERRPLVSIIIVSYNRMDLLDKCLARIKEAQISIPYEVIVVDNGSENWNRDKILEKFPSVTLIENEQNNFYAGANNQAMMVAQGRYFLLLNTDAFLESGVCEGLVRFMEANPGIGAAGPRINNADGSIQSLGMMFPDPNI